MTLITELRPDQVFCYGSNQSGFHGAGAAGFAMRGTAANTWRTDEAFLRAMRAPVGHPDRVGKWAVYGVSRGWQKGREGMSYAIETVTRPGARRSVLLGDIQEQLFDLIGFAHFHPQWEFLMTPVGASLAGYTDGEMRTIFDLAASNVLVHLNPYLGRFTVPDDLYGGTQWGKLLADQPQWAKIKPRPSGEAETGRS